MSFHNPLHNPFSTRFVKPGTIPYRFAEDTVEVPSDEAATPPQHWTTILDRLRENGWWGQIVGPHGTGKSTLLVELLVRLDLGGIVTAHFELHDGQRRFPYRLADLLEHDPIPQLIVIDGYEQLGFWSRRQVTRWCRRQQVGLLVTTHSSLHFPTLFETEASLSMAESLVRERLKSLGSEAQITPEEIRSRFEAAKGNVRELFFSLYDLVEQKRRNS